MGLETPTYVSDFVPTNPPSGDPKGQGDDHIRNIKTALQNTFPNAAKAFYFPDSAAKTANFNVLSSDMNKTFLVDTTAGNIDATLPSLASGDAGWECSFIKTNTGTNPYFIVPPSGTIQSGDISGLTKTRRCIPGARCKAIWTGTAWIAERAPSIGGPVGSVIEFVGSSLPVGYEWPNGTSVASAALYPDYNSKRGGLTVPDRRGRVAAGKDDMGGASANRLTNQSGGLNGDTLEAVGGSETHTLVEAELAAHDHTITDPGHDHPITQEANLFAIRNNLNTGSGFTASTNAISSINVESNTTGITVDNAGGGGAHNNVQPTIIENFILVVE